LLLVKGQASDLPPVHGHRSGAGRTDEIEL